MYLTRPLAPEEASLYARFDSAPNLALFCDYENVAIGARDAHYDGFDLNLVLGRLLDKGNILVKKAYADWSNFKSTRTSIHEAGFELIEIPNFPNRGKNSADIRLVVDALDLCYTKPHVDCFVVISGDSDFSPLVQKLRENNKMVIGLGVKNSTGHVLVGSCDEFIYYDDLVRRVDKRPGRVVERRPPRSDRDLKDREPPRAVEPPRPVERQEPVKAEPVKPALEPAKTVEPRAVEKAPEGEPKVRKTEEERRLEALELVLDTVDSLFLEREDSLWGSMIKQTIKRKQPHFSEQFHGYRTFSALLEDAQRRELLVLHRDERSGNYQVVGFGPKA